jgi:hypothetical protein
MAFEKYILVDFENVQQIDMDVVDEKTCLMIFVGESQINLPTDLVVQTHLKGSSVEWKRIKTRSKKNALDFIIAYTLGSLVKENKDAAYCIYTKDKGYDPLVEYMAAQGIKIQRIEQCTPTAFKKKAAKIPEAVKTAAALPELSSTDAGKALEKLQKLAARKRPKTRKGLAGYIKNITHLDDVEQIVDELVAKQLVEETGKHIRYALP